jgi:DNA-binding PadR family transcriptional regulator
MGRHRHGHGFGRFGGGFGGSGMGGRGFAAGRKLASGDLQLVILALLADKPHHGYEIIKALEERSGGYYAPSPGMVYPALTYLEEIGHATVEAEGAKKLYRITDAGRSHVEANRSLADAILQQLERIGRKMERVRQVFSDEEPAEGGHADADEPREDRRWQRDLLDARRNLKAALALKAGAPAEEQRRIAGILRRAIDDIRKG